MTIIGLNSKLYELARIGILSECDLLLYLAKEFMDAKNCRKVYKVFSIIPSKTRSPEMILWKVKKTCNKES